MSFGGMIEWSSLRGRGSVMERKQCQKGNTGGGFLGKVNMEEMGSNVSKVCEDNLVK